MNRAAYFLVGILQYGSVFLEGGGVVLLPLKTIVYFQHLGVGHLGDGGVGCAGMGVEGAVGGAEWGGRGRG